MFNSEEYILDDFMPVESKPVIDFDDSSCSTISASEGKERKLRVLIKKLPKKLIEQYFGRNDEESRVSLQSPHKKKRGRPRKEFPRISLNTHKRSRPLHHQSLEISKRSFNITKTEVDKTAHFNKTLKQTPKSKPYQIDPVIVDSTKILKIKQPISKNDPLTIPSFTREALIRDLAQEVENERENEIVANEADSELTDAESETEKINEPDVVKRIFLSTKSVQTKFTCNGNICGLIDSNEFNLNCFYCYEIFPLYKWLSFKNHIKSKHQIEENLNQTDRPLESITITPSDQSKSELNTPKVGAIRVKLTEDLNYQTSVPNMINMKHPVTSPSDMKSVLKRSLLKRRAKSTIDLKNRTSLTNMQNSNIQERSLLKESVISNHLNRTLKFTYYKIPLASTQLEPSQENVLAQNSEGTKEIPKEISDLSSVPTKVTSSFSQQNESSSSVARKRKKSSSNEDLNTSYVDEVINLDDDSGEEEENVVPLSKTKTVLDSSSANETIPKNSNTVVSYSELTQAATPNLKAITITKFDTSASNKADNAESQPILKKTYIKIPANLSLEEVLKIIPKPKVFPEATQSTGSAESEVPAVQRVEQQAENVKESANLEETEEDSLITRITKRNRHDDVDAMPSDDENEDEVPRPTNGCGILFGLTHSLVVVEFLQKLAYYPQLWRAHLNDDSTETQTYILQLCCHLNRRFHLNIQDYEMRLSIQRVKDWYCRTMKNMFLHNKNPSNTEPFEHTFPDYFEILNKNLLLYKRFKNENLNTSDYFKMVEKEQTPKRRRRRRKTKISTENDVIEFDADILYGVDDTDGGVIFQKPKPPLKRQIRRRRRPNQKKKPLVCDVCDKTFFSRTEFQRHRNVHRQKGQLQFKCNYCSRVFSLKKFAEACNHRKMRRFMCESCGLTYASETNLKAHLREKHLHLRHKCVVCKFTATTNFRIVQHQKKHHIVEPGTVEEIAKKSRPRTDRWTPYTAEQMQAYLWRKEMRATMTFQPGERFHGCSKCRINFSTRSEKLLHNKAVHPVRDNTVICPICKVCTHSIRKHYTDTHEIPWDVIDELLAHTQPVIKLLTAEEIELVNSSENYIESIKEIMAKRNLFIDAAAIIEKSLQPAEDLSTEPSQQQMGGEQDAKLENSQIMDVINSSLEENASADYVPDHDYNNDYYKNEEIVVDNYAGEAGETGEAVDNIYHEIYENADGTIVETQNINDHGEMQIIERDADYLAYELAGDQMTEENIVEEYIEEDYILEEILEDEVVDEVMEEEVLEEVLEEVIEQEVNEGFFQHT